MNVFQEQINFFRSPKTVLERLASNEKGFAVGFRHTLTMALLYWGVILLWAFSADGVTLPAFLRIPEETYYFYELIFLIPLFICTWLLASAIAYLVSRAMGGSGSFDAILAGFGLTVAVSSYFTLIPDYIQGTLWVTGWVPFAEYQRITGQGLLLILVGSI